MTHQLRSRLSTVTARGEVDLKKFYENCNYAISIGYAGPQLLPRTGVPSPSY